MKLVDNLLRDLIYAGRMLGKSPVFAAAAIVTIALGIGASTAIFSVTNAVLLRPLPYKNPDRLVLACRDFTKSDARDLLFSNADFFDLRDGTKSVFEELGGVFTFRAIVPREDGSAEQISKAQVTTNFFGMMGAKIALGRDFTEADGQPQPTQPEPGLPLGSAAILSYEYWQRRYGGNAGVIGREMLSAGVMPQSRGPWDKLQLVSGSIRKGSGQAGSLSHPGAQAVAPETEALGSGQRGPRIVGVLAQGFKLFFPPGATTDARPEVWIANNLGYDNAHRNLVTLRVIGSLKDGVRLERAQEQVDLVTAELRKNFSWYATSGMSIRLEPMHGRLVAEVRPACWYATGHGRSSRGGWHSCARFKAGCVRCRASRT